MSQTEFQVVVLAGGSGSRMSPLVSPTGKPKALLPVCNRPMLFHQLYLLEKAGLADVIVAVSPDAYGPITLYIDQIYPLDPLVVELRRSGRDPLLDQSNMVDSPETSSGQPIVVQVEDGSGTADALRFLKPRVHARYVMVLSSDLLFDSALHDLADVHRVTDPAVTVLLKRAADEVEVHQPENYIALAPSDSRETRAHGLIHFEAAADVENELSVPRSLLTRFPSFTMQTNLRDAHAYIFSRWVLDLLVERQSISSIRYQLVPFLVRNQFKFQKYAASLPEELATPRPTQTEFESNQTTSAIREPWVPDIPTPPKYMSLSSKGRSRSTSHTAAVHQASCSALVLPKTTYSARVNTVESFVQANRDVAAGSVKYLPKAAFKLIDGVLEHRGERCNISADSTVGSSVRLGDRSSVKKSVVGSHCSIGNNVKLLNCVVMDHVTIADRSNIQGSVICSNAHIQAGCVMKDCQVGSSVTVGESTEAKGETFEGGQDGDGDGLFY